MQRSVLTSILGTFLSLQGFFGLMLAGANWITSFLPQPNPLTFSTSAGFFLLGVALLCVRFTTPITKKIHFVLATLIIVSALTLPAIQQNIFLFAGLTLIFLHLRQLNFIKFLTPVGIFIILTLSFSHALHYFLNLDLSNGSFALPAALSFINIIGNIVLSLGLWALWNKQIEMNEIIYKKETCTFLLSLTFLFWMGLLSGIIVWKISSSSFWMMHFQEKIIIAIVVGGSILLGQLIIFTRHSVIAANELLKNNLLLAKKENQFRSAFNKAGIGMALIFPGGKFFKVNQALCKILGYKKKELLSLNHQHILYLEDLHAHNKIIEQLTQGKKKIKQKIRRYVHKNGQVIWTTLTLSSIKDKNNSLIYFIAQVQNITSEKLMEEELRHLAYHDALTDLYNRTCLEQKLQDILANAQRYDKGFAIVFLDLDRFKNINDTIGHDAGDLLLQIIGQRLKKNLRATDIIARVGGDEFVFVLNSLQQVERISGIVQKILSHLLEPIMLKGQEIYITTSMGISIYPHDGHDVATLMKNADLALYRAKELGRNNYQFCTVEMTTRAQQKMLQQNAIVEAMAKNEFTLYFQPKLNLSNQVISGVEALLRWPNEKYSHIGTGEIIHLAEQTGSIISLNEWVLRSGCKQVKKWHEAGFFPLNLSVNLSGKQFKQINFTKNLLEILAEVDFPPECLELEITEDLIMQDPEYIFHILHSLKEKNISIAIDDFGTGYSSLAYLHRFSIDKIKIDRKFIQLLTVDAVSTSIVSAIIAMANKLEIKTIAEGVETEQQYNFLLQEKCTEIQGYYLSQPADVETISKFLKNPINF